MVNPAFPVLVPLLLCVQVAERQAGRKIMVDTGGASGGGFDARKGQHEFSWRDAMDIPVRWRQLSEPNDQVWYAAYRVPITLLLQLLL